MITEDNDRAATSLRTWLPHWAGSDPTHPALVNAIDGTTLDVGSLWAAVQAASTELRAAGLSAGDRLGIAAARHVDTVVWILAAVDAGVGYVPFDLDYPPARLRARSGRFRSAPACAPCCSPRHNRAPRSAP